MSEGIQNFREERLDVLAGTRGDAGDKAVRVKDMDSAINGHMQGRNLAKAAVMTVDAALTTSGAWVSGPSITLPSGLWMVSAQVQLRADATLGALTNVCARLWDGSVEFATAEATMAAASGESRGLHLSCLISTKIQRVITLQGKPATGNANLKMKSTLSPLSAGSQTATRLWAVRIGF